MRLLLRWTEQRMQMDLDGDGNVGIVLHDQSWFIEAVKWWFSGGSTKYEASTKALGITYAQWKAARTALKGSGIAIGVRRQGGSQGFEIKKKSWNDRPKVPCRCAKCKANPPSSTVQLASPWILLFLSD